MERPPGREWSDAALASEAVTKRMLAQFLVVNATTEFLEAKGIRVSTTALVAKLPKDLLVATYKEVCAARAFRDPADIARAAAAAEAEAKMEEYARAEAAAAKEAAASPGPVAEVKAKRIDLTAELTALWARNPPKDDHASCLPLDLLALIFAAFPVRPRLLVLRRVCKRWAAAAMRPPMPQPALCLHVPDDQTAATKLLAAPVSRSLASLVVHAHSDAPFAGTSLTDLELHTYRLPPSCSCSAFALISSLRSLTISVSLACACARKMLHASRASLTSLAISFPQRDRKRDPGRLARSLAALQMPHLRSLSLRISRRELCEAAVALVASHASQLASLCLWGDRWPSSCLQSLAAIPFPLLSHFGHDEMYKETPARGCIFAAVVANAPLLRSLHIAIYASQPLPHALTALVTDMSCFFDAFMPSLALPALTALRSLQTPAAIAGLRFFTPLLTQLKRLESRRPIDVGFLNRFTALTALAIPTYDQAMRFPLVTDLEFTDAANTWFKVSGHSLLASFPALRRLRVTFDWRTHAAEFVDAALLDLLRAAQSAGVELLRVTSTDAELSEALMGAARGLQWMHVVVIFPRAEGD